MEEQTKKFTRPTVQQITTGWYQRLKSPVYIEPFKPEMADKVQDLGKGCLRHYINTNSGFRFVDESMLVITDEKGNRWPVSADKVSGQYRSLDEIGEKFNQIRQAVDGLNNQQLEQTLDELSVLLSLGVLEESKNED